MPLRETLHRTEAEDLPLADDTFDHVFMVEVQQPLQEAGKALREAMPVSRAEGKFLVAVPNNDWFEYEHHMRTMGKSRPIDERWGWYGTEEIKELLKEWPIPPAVFSPAPAARCGPRPSPNENGWGIPSHPKRAAHRFGSPGTRRISGCTSLTRCWCSRRSCFRVTRRT